MHSYTASNPGPAALSHDQSPARSHCWEIALCADDGTVLALIATDDAGLWPLLADRMRGAWVERGVVAGAELRQFGAVVERREYVFKSRVAR